MTHTSLYTSGIVAYYQSSLEFSILGNTLLLQSGVAYDAQGNVLALPKASYVVLENIALIHFENNQTYYFYITSEDSFLRLPSDTFLTSSKLEENIYFFISTQTCDTCTELGQIEIDYDLGHTQERRSIAIANNAFYPGKNEIDSRNVCRYTPLPSPVTELQCRNIQQVLAGLSKVLYHKMVQENRLEFSTLCTALFHFSDDVMTQRYSPHALYKKFENLDTLFSWLHSTKREEDLTNMEGVFAKFEMLFKTSEKTFNTRYYHLELEREESLFYQVLQSLQEITESLQQSSVTLEKAPISRQKEPGLQEDVSMDHFDAKPFVSENITVVEAVSPEEEESTIMVFSNNRESYIQIGRGTQNDNDIVLGENDKTISRVHLRITAHKQGFFIEDLSSMGTYVNEERIKKNVKKFVTMKHHVVLGKKNCLLDLSDVKIQALA